MPKRVDFTMDCCVLDTFIETNRREPVNGSEVSMAHFVNKNMNYDEEIQIDANHDMFVWSDVYDELMQSKRENKTLKEKIWTLELHARANKSNV
jgi:hypothetical protein